jgi:hypothetical protein
MKLSPAIILRMVALALAVGLAPNSYANYTFSGSGTSGNFTGQAGEPFSVNFDGGTLMPDWGSPGVSAGVTPYLESSPAFGLILTFAGGGPINANQIAIGNGAACGGTTVGGTTFCTLSSTVNDIWDAFLVGTNTIEFLAQDSSFYLTHGQNYFVNIFFDREAPTSFTGTWLTEFSPNPTTVPEPATLSLIGLGIAGIAVSRRRRKQ